MQQIKNVFFSLMLEHVNVLLRGRVFGCISQIHPPCCHLSWGAFCTLLLVAHRSHSSDVWSYLFAVWTAAAA